MVGKKNSPAAGAGLDNSAASVEIRALDSLAAYARNARTHDEDQVAQLMGSIIEFGWTNPVLADENGIVAGHGRCAAARKLYAQGKAIRLPNGKEIPAGTVPVIDVTGWSEAKRKAYIIADNKLAENAGWDDEMLAVELDELRDMDFDLGLLGFDKKALDDLIGTPDDPKDKPEDDGIDYEEKFAVLVECSGEQHQAEIFSQLTEMGLSCKVLVN